MVHTKQKGKTNWGILTRSQREASSQEIRILRSTDRENFLAHEKRREKQVKEKNTRRSE